MFIRYYLVNHSIRNILKTIHPIEPELNTLNGERNRCGKVVLELTVLISYIFLFTSRTVFCKAAGVFNNL